MVNVGVNVPYIESFGKKLQPIEKEGAGTSKMEVWFRWNQVALGVGDHVAKLMPRMFKNCQDMVILKVSLQGWVPTIDIKGVITFFRMALQMGQLGS